MKLKFLVKLVELFMGESDQERTELDMYLPNWMLAFGIVLMALGTVGVLSIFFLSDLKFLLLGVFLFILGIVARMCWKNQTVRMISDTQFEYTTFLGKTHCYNFSDITGLKKNNDSMTLFVGNNKVHIESCALLSDRFAQAVNNALDQ